MSNQLLSHLLAFLSIHGEVIIDSSVSILSIIVHFLDARQHMLSRILVFPGLLLNIYVYSVRQLYSRVFYSLVGILLHIYAYFKWKGQSKNPLSKVTKTSGRVRLFLMLLGLFGAFAWTLATHRFVQLPLTVIYLDASYTFFGFIEKWLMAHKKVERWLLSLARYILFSIACYRAGALVLGLQHIILASVAFYGQIKWYRSYKKNT